MVQAITFGLLVVVLLVAALSDWRSGRIPNWLTYPAMLLGLILWSALDPHGAGEGLSRSAVALAAGLVPMALIFSAGGLGGGDVKLMGAIGSLSGQWRCVLDAAVYAFLIAGVMAIILMIRRHLVMQTLRRILGMAISAFSRTRMDPAADSPRVAFGVALALGGVMAAADHLLGFNWPWSIWIG